MARRRKPIAFGVLPTPSVSVLVPSRNRIDQLVDSLNSLRSTADDWFGKVEVIIRADYDDPSFARLPELLEFNGKVVVGHRGGGYADLHRFYGDCARAAGGRHLLLWDDSVKMKTQGWDTAINSIKEEHEIYHATFNKEHGWVFPIIPRKLVELLGYVAPRPYYAVWLGDVLTNLGSGAPFYYFDKIMLEREPRPIQDWDQTYKERQPVVDHCNVTDIHLPEIAEWKLRDRDKIKAFLAEKVK